MLGDRRITWTLLGPPGAIPGPTEGSARVKEERWRYLVGNTQRKQTVCSVKCKIPSKSIKSCCTDSKGFHFQQMLKQWLETRTWVKSQLHHLLCIKNTTNSFSVLFKDGSHQRSDSLWVYAQFPMTSFPFSQRCQWDESYFWSCSVKVCMNFRVQINPNPAGLTLHLQVTFDNIYLIVNIQKLSKIVALVSFGIRF